MLSLSSKLLKNAVANRSSAISGGSVAKALFSTKNGTCKWFNVQKGYGFIAPDDGSDDVFVHQTVVHANGFRSLAVSGHHRQSCSLCGVNLVSMLLLIFFHVFICYL